MTTTPVQIETDGVSNSASASASESNWDAVRADESIQFSPVEPKETPEPAEPPGWLTDFLRWIGELFEPVGALFGSSWPVVKWVLVAGAVAFALILLWKLLAPVLDLRRNASPEHEDEWAPEESEAIALLGDADKLASEGRYDEATHLLLQRSVGQIAAVQPDLVEPSSTARELATLPELPDAARTAFGTISERVERSLFALKRLGVDDWQAARAAYAKFALQRLADDR